MSIIHMISYYVHKYLHKDEKGATALEYGLIAALIAVVIAGILYTVGGNLKNTFTNVSDCLANSANC